MYSFVVLRITIDHETLVSGVFSSKDAAMPTVENIRSQQDRHGNRDEAMIVQWELNGRRVAYWSYDDCEEGRYYIYPIE